MRSDILIARGENEVHLHLDPTKHSEMVEITLAAAALDRPDLAGCTILSTLQPCEMFLTAIRFAGIDRNLFAATQDRVAAKYFVFGHLSIENFQDGNFGFFGGLHEDEVIHLYATGSE